MITICTIKFRNSAFYMVLYGSQNTNHFPDNMNQMVFIMDVDYVLCEVGVQFLCSLDECHSSEDWFSNGKNLWIYVFVQHSYHYT
jgi:hypothetical protein